MLDNNYLFLTNDNELKIIDFKRALIIKSYKGKRKILSIKEIFHPIFGKCIITLEENKKINLLKITETYDDIKENISPNLHNNLFDEDGGHFYLYMSSFDYFNKFIFTHN